MSIKIYKLKSLSLNLCGKVFKKIDNPVFSTENLPSGKLEDAEKAGFLVFDEKLTKAANKCNKAEAEAKTKTKAEAEAKVKAEAEAEFPLDMPGREELILNNIITYKQLNDIEDLTELEGIGIATAKKINDYLAENN